MDKDLPQFEAWDIKTLANFAKDTYIRLREMQEANEQLRLDLKDAMKLVRQQHNKDDWK